MDTTNASIVCPPHSDNAFGPRVTTDCRSFDFTLLFEDAFFSLLPAALFLLILPGRVLYLARASVKVRPHRLAIYKTISLSILLILHIVYTILQRETAVLQTTLSTASGVVQSLATAGCIVLSILEDRSSISPSSLLVLYLSLLTILGIPRLRSLSLIQTENVCQGLWTAIFIITVLAVIQQSLCKIAFLHTCYGDIGSEQRVGFWSRSFYTWVIPLLRQGYRDILEVKQIPKAETRLDSQYSLRKLQHAWENSKPKQRLVKAVFRAYLDTLLLGVPPRLALSAFTFCQPFLINTTIHLFQENGEDVRFYSRMLILAFALNYAGMAISRAVYARQTNRLAAMARAGLISIIYQHTTALTRSEVHDVAAVTLMGTDVERIWISLKTLHDCWASLLEVAVAIYLLERQVRAACVVPAIVSMVCLCGTFLISTRMATAQRAWVEKVQVRLTVTSTMLGNIKAVKMLGLTDVLYQMLSSLRQIELNTSQRFRKLLLCTVSLSNIPLDFAPFATFAVYAIMSVINDDKSLLTTQAFTSLSLISLMTSPLLTFVQAVPQLLQSQACFDRIEAYLSRNPTTPNGQALVPNVLEKAASNNSTSLSPSCRDGIDKNTLISFRGVDISWSLKSEPVFENFSLDIGQGITMIIGPVGSGKSTLIETIIRETIVKKGHINANFSDVAYCGQTPWMMNKSIRYNITCEDLVNEEWYNQCLSMCSLKKDLMLFPAGDMYVPGSDGNGLSGGQKQRIALARALYSKLPVAVLDDAFSGLDLNNIRMISEHLFGKNGFFRGAGRSVILATHTSSLLSFADEIIVIDNGAVISRGSYTEIFSAVPKVALQSLEQIDEEEVPTTDEGLNANSPISLAVENKANPRVGQQELDISRRDGTWGVYRFYVQNAGLWTTCCFVISAFLAAFVMTFCTIWIQWWAEANAKHPNSHLGRWLGVYTALSVLNITLFIGSTYLLFVKVINHTGVGLHTILLKTTLNAPLAFFHQTDSGVTTNRFNQDMDIIDMRLPSAAVGFIGGLALCVVKLVVLCVMGKYLAISLPFLIGTIMIIQRIYLRTCRQLRLLDIEAKSPLYSQFLETLKGLSVIRAFAWESRLHHLFEENMNYSQRPFYMLLSVQQWLIIVLDLVLAGMAVILVAITTSLRDKFTPGEIGVALNLVLTFNQSLVQTINSWTQLEISIGAVSRVQQFAKTPSERRASVANAAASHGWPREGTVVFDRVTASYGPSNPPVLRNVSLNIKAGQKIAICGASGSGKTSLFMALLQMVDIQSGSISIDGQRLSDLDPEVVRNRVNVIPQEPFFLPETVRYNLDPHAKVTDDRLELAIQKVRLWDRMSGNGGLNMRLNPSTWSSGERQLLALARALVRNSPLLLLDEAASSVDDTTAAFIQQIIDEEFRDHTILAILHRFACIEGYDYIVVLERGVVVEFDAPPVLLGRDSKFRTLYTAMEKET
ncbi:P-loop containing nucleoside triphosphate hydrolase protein [Aspergillus parasiticus]|uniref:P-loop containing nucleoside triphosphate hydrolase protein n=1 Tax=Aspergillus parasiticus TaxID=5067 RepID=A0A5N6DMY7_ASPPA|nr:P-loop containing nucleoside triphosphate hydrolase protein [Aspergillus parasiticus]